MEKTILILAAFTLLFLSISLEAVVAQSVSSRMEGTHRIDQRSWLTIQLADAHQISHKKEDALTESRNAINAEVKYYIKDAEKIFNERGIAMRAKSATDDFLEKFSDAVSRNNKREDSIHTEDMMANYQLASKPDWQVEYDESGETWECSCSTVVINEKLLLWYWPKKQPTRPSSPDRMMVPQRPAPPPNYLRPGVIPGYR
jgi:hypothetical protein